MIMQLCDEHKELIGTFTIEEIREQWTWWHCQCLIILDKD